VVESSQEWLRELLIENQQLRMALAEVKARGEWTALTAAPGAVEMTVSERMIKNSLAQL